MSFFDDASLVFLPSGEAGKDGKAYSMKPTNGNGDFTFSRGSNLTATRVDSNGLIEKGRENLLLQSNQFDTTWSTSGSPSLSSGQSGYDGSTDAWLLTKTSSGAQSVYQYITQLGVATMSVYAKAGSTNWMRLTHGGKTAYFDLSGSGAIGVTSNGIDQTITSVGNGWFRCTLTANRTIAGQTPIYPYTAEGDSSGSSDSIYIQDAQLEIGLTATEPIESGATTGKAGLLEDSPRFDFSGGASCPSLLLEPSRTSLYQYSEYIFNFQGTNTFNAANSPEGVSNAILLTKTSASDQFVNMSWSGSSLSPSTDYTMSLFVKYNGYDVDVRYEYNNFNDWGKGWNALFQVRSSGVTASTTASCTSDVKDYGNGWYRIIVNVTTASSITPTASSNLVRIIGASADEVLIYGAGMEQGSYPTSYIPNHSGGSVTRAADVNTLLNQSGVIGQTAGTILFDAYFDEADKVNFSISDSTSSNYFSIETTSGKQVFGVIRQGGSTQAAISTSPQFFTEGDRLKCAIAYDDRDMAFYINGTQVGTAAPNLIPACDDIRFARYNGALAANQRVNRVVLFDTRISNGNLATLTS